MQDHGNLAYFAVAHVANVTQDPITASLAYAWLTEFLPFDAPVPWYDNERYAERALRELPRGQVGVFLRGRSVRTLDDIDFASIIARGFSDTTSSAIVERYGLPPDISTFDREHGMPAAERALRISTALSNRILRDASFRRAVCRAYDDRCAVTGMRIVDGRGRIEAQAAHIWSVADGGPDVVQNGIALCATAHWLFDRHIISLNDDYSLLFSSEEVPQALRSIFPDAGQRVLLPADKHAWPHPTYLARHRARLGCA